MKVKYVFNSTDEVNQVVESNFIPLVGDYVSLAGCAVPHHLTTNKLKVMNRTYSIIDDLVIVSLGYSRE